eukprot:758976-Hanusia_phi.AAC.2
MTANRIFPKPFVENLVEAAKLQVINLDNNLIDSVTARDAPGRGGGGLRESEGFEDEETIEETWDRSLLVIHGV